ncbi:MAG: hypothetical protein V4699_01225 [Patescibacteria group bacterium]
MRAISSKLNIYIKNISFINTNIEKLLFNFILWSFGALVVLYVMFLGNMVKNIVERRGFESDARALSSEVSNLELTYLAMSNNIDLKYSYSLGFKETKANFATRKSLGYKPLESGNVKAVHNDL